MIFLFSEILWSVVFSFSENIFSPPILTLQNTWSKVRLWNGLIASLFFLFLFLSALSFSQIMNEHFETEELMMLNFVHLFINNLRL